MADPEALLAVAAEAPLPPPVMIEEAEAAPLPPPIAAAGEGGDVGSSSLSPAAAAGVDSPGSSGGMSKPRSDSSVGANEVVPGGHAEAKWPYESQGHTMSSGDKDVSMAKGDRMVVDAVLGEWARVSTTGLKYGVVPISHLGPLRYVQALYRYAPSGSVMSTGDIDIGFSKGDVMLVLTELPTDWLRVQHDLNGVGVVPSTYCEPISPPHSFPPPDSSVLDEAASSRATRRKTMMLTNRIAKEKKSATMPARERRVASQDRSQSSPNVRPSASGTARRLMTASGTVGRSGSMSMGTSSDTEKLAKAPVWPDSYPFSERDSPTNLLFLDDLVDGHPQVKAGTLVKLVERLTLPEYVEPHFARDVLLTYRSFTTAEQLFDVLVQRFRVPDPPLNLGAQAPESMSDAEIEEQLGIYFRTVLKPIQLRVINVLKRWVEELFHDLAENSDVLAKLRKFISEDLSAANLETAAKSLTRALEKREAMAQKALASNDDGWYEEEYTFSEPPPPSIEPDVAQLAKVDASLALFQMDPLEVARQVCLIEHDLFQRIRPWECLGQRWAKPQSQAEAPHIMASIRRFNSFSLFVASTVLQVADKSKRGKMIEVWTSIARHLKSLNNFNGCMAILAGLRQSAVHRLAKTWKSVSKSSRKQFSALIEEMSPDMNYRQYRAELKAVSPPCVPYLGVYLTDLTFIEDGNQDEVEGAAGGGARRRRPSNAAPPTKLINFDKRRRLTQVIQDIRTFQLARYNFKEVPIIQGALLAGGEFVDENKMYELSLSIEPRAGNAAAAKALRKTVRSRKGVHKMSILNVSSVPHSPRASADILPETPSAVDLDSARAKVVAATTSKEEVTMDDLVLALHEGGEKDVDAYLAAREMTVAEQESMKEQALRLLDLHRNKQNAQRVDDSYLVDEEGVEDDQAAVFDQLLGWLLAGETAQFDAYLSNLGLFQAQRIRDQALQMFEQELAARGEKK
jgi:RasGEF domain/RasGEF N-terminal motif